ncbi:MAG: NYN domain-containing protein [Candidatus Competibacteraceae bacterium]|nr:NYN domain-containing protein [Candidatus Competibacteraceae bacterium]
MFYQKIGSSLGVQLAQHFHRPAPTLPTSPYAWTPPLIFQAVTEDTAIVADNSNVFQGGYPQGYRLDFGQLMFAILGGDNLVEARFFASAPPSKAPKYHAQWGFYEFLRQVGWRVHLSKLLRCDGHFAENENSVDGGVCAAVRRYATDPRVDTVVLLSGDGRMTNSVHEAVRKGKKVVVLAWRGTLHPALEAAATAHFHLNDLRPLLERKFC